MVFAKYTYPLPNDGHKYSLSEKELVELLDAAYDKGFEHGVQSATPVKTTKAKENNHGQKN